MKKNLFAGLMIVGLSAFAQTPRLSLFEEFTGENCAPCAATNPGLNTILAASTNTSKVVAIKWQVPIPSAPTPTWSLYKTNQAEIDWRYTGGGYGYPSQWTSTTAPTSGINAAPTGLFDGQHQWVFGATSDHPFYVSNSVISTAQSYTSAFSISLTTAWDNTYSSYNCTVNIQASATFTATGSLLFRLVMIEKEIHFPTPPGTNGEKDFEDVAIKSFPSLQAGTPMAGVWAVNQIQTFTLNCPLPSYVRDKSQVAFVGFIQDDGNRKVAQAVRALPKLLPNDAQAVSVSVPMTCTNTATPMVTVKNLGNNAITGFNITPYVNSVPGSPFAWSGNLAVGASTTFALNSINVAQGANTFSYNITSVTGTDYNTLNNTALVKFLGVLNYQGTPVAEGFLASTFPPTNWSTNNNYNGATWIRVTNAGGFGTSSESTKLDFYNTIPAGAVNELYLPAVSFSGAPTMSFDVAYAQYAAADNDQLDVEVSTDCGLTWTNEYSKAGTVLTTVSAPVTPAFVPTSSQWRKEVVNLAAYAGMNIIIRFVGTSDYGNNLYIDNINLSACLAQNITLSSSSPTSCAGQPVTLTAGGATTYSWSSSSQTGNQITVSPASTTNYVVTSNDPNSCKNSASIVQTVNQCVGIGGNALNISQLSLSPNPAQNVTSLNIDLVQTEIYKVTVLNSVGQLVHSSTHNLSTGANSIAIHTENWANGVYFVNVSSASGTTNTKLTIAK
jgi:hypothetical protein